VASQVFYFLITIFTGLLIGIFFDVYRELQMVLKLKRLGTNISDFLFWVFATFFVFFLLLYTSYGEVRAFGFIGIGMGLLLYTSYFSRWSRKIIRLTFSLLFKVIFLVWSVIRLPVIFFQKMLLFPANLISLGLLKAVKFMAKIFKALFRRNS